MSQAGSPRSWEKLEHVGSLESELSAILRLPLIAQAAVAVATAFAVVSTSIATAILRMRKQWNSICYRELPGEVCYCYLFGIIRND